jgi:hypothetical protein
MLMANIKKKNKVWIGISIILILLFLIGGGIYFFLQIGTHSEIFVNNEDSKISLKLYDANGNEIKSNMQQTTVFSGARSQTGVFYLSMKIFLNNNGNSTLTNIRVVPDETNELYKSLSNQNPSQTYLNKGQNGILFLDTANPCNSNSDCGSNEACVGTITKKCLINLEQLAGNVTFSIQILADYFNAYGITQTTGITTGLTLAFTSDNVAFRTNVNVQTFTIFNFIDGSASNPTTDGKERWIALDMNGDNILEKYGHYSSIRGTNVWCQERVLPILQYLNYGNNIDSDIWVLKYSSSEIEICYNDDDSPHHSTSGSYKLDYGKSPQDAITYAIPLEPFKSQNCGGIIPCQERYKAQTSIPIQTCNDNAKNQDETDADCGGSICTKRCGYSKTCTQASDCLSNLCSNGVCSVREWVNYRVNNNWNPPTELAFSPNCTTNLTKYSLTNSYEIESSRCNTSTYLSSSDLLSYGVAGHFSNPSHTSCVANEDASGNQILELYNDVNNNDVLWLCLDYNCTSINQYVKISRFIKSSGASISPDARFDYSLTLPYSYQTTCQP